MPRRKATKPRPRPDPRPRAVGRAVTRLRRKLGDNAGNPRYILCECGLGYCMTEPDRVRGPAGSRPARQRYGHAT